MFKVPTIVDTTQSINWKDTPCTRLSLPLFNPSHPDKVHFSDVIQGEVGSCWFLSVLISYLRPNSKNIVDRSTDIYNSVKIYRTDSDRIIYKVKLDGKKVLVDDYVPNTYHKTSSKKSCQLKCSWFILFEKAMLSLMTFYRDHKSGSIYRDMIYVHNINTKNGEMKAATIGIGYMIPFHFIFNVFLVSEHCPMEQKFLVSHPQLDCCSLMANYRFLSFYQ